MTRWCEATVDLFESEPTLSPPAGGGVAPASADGVVGAAGEFPDWRASAPLASSNSAFYIFNFAFPFSLRRPINSNLIFRKRTICA